MNASHALLALRFGLAALILLVACEQPLPPDEVAPPEITAVGSMSIAVDQSTVPPEVAKIVVRLERSGYVTLRDSLLVAGVAPDSSVLVIPNIPAGPWMLTVKAFDANGVERYQGSATVEVIANAVTGVAVIMRPTGPGVGTLVITLIWESSVPGRSWQSSRANPVLAQSDSGWDASHYYVSEPFVLAEDGNYRMWYTTGLGGLQMIAAAASSDGIVWRKQGVVIGPSGTDANLASGASSPSVLKIDGVYHMWFNGKLSIDLPHGGIRHATSIDGLQWTVDPVHAIPLEYPATGIFGVNVIRTDSLLRMYYTVETTVGALRSYSIHLAESFFGGAWMRRGPVLQARPSVPWEQGGVFTPHVIIRNGMFVMYYTAGNTSGGASIGKAMSSDGVRWTRSSTTPDFDPAMAMPWSVRSVGYPSVLEEGGKLKMWFAGLSMAQDRWQIGLAVER